MTKPVLDDVDREIINRLSVDARLSNRAIAAALGVTEGTIRARLKRMREAHLIRFTALTNLSRIGPMRVIFFRVRSEISRTRAVAEQIAKMPEIKCVIITTGRFSILAMGVVAELEREVEDISARIGALRDVVGLEMSISIHTTKYNVRTAKIVPMPHQTGGDEDGEDEDIPRPDSLL